MNAEKGTPDYEKHNEQVRKLYADLNECKNSRIPIVFAIDEAVMLELCGRTFGQFYREPAVHLEVKLTASKWFCENIVHDQIMGPPKDHWTIGPSWWMDEPEFFGCNVVIQENDFAWSEPLDMSKAKLIKHLESLDPVRQIESGTMMRLYEGMQSACQNREFYGLPVKVARPGGIGTHGVFTVGARIRAIEQICIDMYEDPQFVKEFFRLVTDLIIERAKAWDRIWGIEREYPLNAGYGICDDSIELLSNEQYREFILPCHRRLYETMGMKPRSIHLCGRAQQHYSTVVQELEISALDGPGRYVDLTETRRLIGKDVFLCAQVNSTDVLYSNSTEVMEEEMKRVLESEAKLPGKMSLLIHVPQMASMQRFAEVYTAGKKYGAIRETAVDVPTPC